MESLFDTLCAFVQSYDTRAKTKTAEACIGRRFLRGS